MKITLATLAGFAAGAWVALYCRRYLGAFVTWAFARGDTPRASRRDRRVG